MTTTPDPRPGRLRPVPDLADTGRIAAAFDLAPRLREILARYDAAVSGNALDRPEPVNYPELAGQLAAALGQALDQLDMARGLAAALFTPARTAAGGAA